MYDVIVIGGGLIGSSITYFLAREGRKVVQIEARDLGSGASGACIQINMIQSKPANDSLLIGMKTVELYREISKDLVLDMEYNEKGGLMIIESDIEYPIVEKLINQQQAMGLEVEILNIKDVKKMQKGLGSHVVAASHCPIDHEINPFKTILGLTQTAKKYGAEIRVNEPVTGIIREKNVIKGVETKKDRLYGDIVINAAGAWAPFIGQMAGLSIPMKPCRGQVFITEAIAPYINKCVMNAKYIIGKSNPETMAGLPPEIEELGIGFCVSQVNKGNLIFGSTREFVGYDTLTTSRGLRAVAQNSLNIFPGLKNLKILRTYSGLRPNSSDGKPLVGFVKGLEGFFMAAGHGGDGTVAAPTTGKMVRDLIIDGKSDMPLTAAYDPNRFELAGQ